jgi:dGTPase
MVGKGIVERHRLDTAPHDFATVVEAASLAHDIGNPPFGHSGESAISAWFGGRLGGDLLADLSEQESRDFQHFEGNAQGFRLLTNLQNHAGNGGLQLTHAVLGAFTKYPCSSDLHGKSTYIGHKKHGFFRAEEEYFSEIANDLGLISVLRWQRVVPASSCISNGDR